MPATPSGGRPRRSASSGASPAEGRPVGDDVPAAEPDAQVRIEVLVHFVAQADGLSRPLLAFDHHRHGSEKGLVRTSTGDLKDVSVYMTRSGGFPQENRQFRLAA